MEFRIGGIMSWIAFLRKRSFSDDFRVKHDPKNQTLSILNTRFSLKSIIINRLEFEIGDIFSPETFYHKVCNFLPQNSGIKQWQMNVEFRTSLLQRHSINSAHQFRSEQIPPDISKVGSWREWWGFSILDARQYSPCLYIFYPIYGDHFFVFKEIFF